MAPSCKLELARFPALLRIQDGAQVWQHELKIRQYMGEIKKKDDEPKKESNRSKVISGSLILAETKLENHKLQEKKLFYNIEKNNNF